MHHDWPQRFSFEGYTPTTPVPAVRLERLRQVAQQIFDEHQAVGICWRPLIGHPVISDVLLAIRESGAVGFSCGRIDVAEALVALGEASVLLTRPPLAGNGPARLAKLAVGTRVRVVCEHFAQAEPLARACESAGSALELLLNLDSGRHRLGVRPGPDMSDLLEGLQSLPCVSAIGLSVGSLQMPGSSGGYLAESQLSHLVDAGARSFARASQTLKAVSLGELHKPGNREGIDIEARTPIVARSAPPFAILSTIIGRPAREIAVIDAGVDELRGYQAGDVVSSESHFKAIMSDSSALVLCGSAQDLFVGDVIAIPVTTANAAWARSVLVGESGAWKVVEATVH